MSNPSGDALVAIGIVETQQQLSTDTIKAAVRANAGCDHNVARRDAAICKEKCRIAETHGLPAEGRLPARGAPEFDVAAQSLQRIKSPDDTQRGSSHTINRRFTSG